MIAAGKEVTRNKFRTEPTMLVNIPTTRDDKNSRFSNEKPSFSAKMN
jgi:hypothetical protein